MAKIFINFAEPGFFVPFFLLNVEILSERLSAAIERGVLIAISESVSWPPHANVVAESTRVNGSNRRKLES